MPDNDLLGHNVQGKLQRLEQEAQAKQLEAQRAWYALMNAQIDHDQPWNRVLESAYKVGLENDQIRRAFNVSPSTLSRWISGASAPVNALRGRLGSEVKQLAKAAIRCVKA